MILPHAVSWAVVKASEPIDLETVDIQPLIQVKGQYWKAEEPISYK